MGYFMRGPTWMRRGTQGPRGRTRLPEWRVCDTWTTYYIYHIVFLYNVYRSSDYRKTDYQPHNIAYFIYWIISINILHVGLFRLFYFVSGRRGSIFARWIKIAMIAWRRCSGHESTQSPNQARAPNQTYVT